MAEKRAGATFETIMKDLKAGRFAPVYVLVGDESYYIDQIADFIAENALKEEERDFNQTVFYGLDSTPAKVMDTAHGAPMMAKYQVVIVKEAQLMRGIDHLEKYLKNPVPSTILVVCYKKEAPKGKKSWIGEAEKNGVVFKSDKLRDYELPGFVSSYLKTKGLDIEQKAQMMIVDSIGNDLARITTEIDKLLLTLSPNEKRVTPEHVEQQIGISKDFNPYELLDAVIKRDIMKANRIVKYFDKNEKEGDIHMICPMLFNYFQNLMIASTCKNRANRAEVAAALELAPEWRANNYMDGLKNYAPLKIMQIISKLRSSLAKSNGVGNRSASSGQLLQELIFFILH